MASGRLPVQQERKDPIDPRADRRETPRREKGRGGKTVSVVDGLPENCPFLKELCQELKRACGTGGAVSGGTIKLQGDLRERIRGLLLEKGFVVKG